MTAEKARFSTKLNEVERALEDKYFAEQDRLLLEKMKRGREKPADEAAQAMLCPRCRKELKADVVEEVAVDRCPSCQGIWLDHGELEAISGIDRDGWIARWLRQGR